MSIACRLQVVGRNRMPRSKKVVGFHSDSDDGGWGDGVPAPATARKPKPPAAAMSDSDDNGGGSDDGGGARTKAKGKASATTSARAQANADKSAKRAAKRKENKAKMAAVLAMGHANAVAATGGAGGAAAAAGGGSGSDAGGSGADSDGDTGAGGGAVAGAGGAILPLCKYGSGCKGSDPHHYETHRHPCTFGDACTRKNPLHFRVSTHPTLRGPPAPAPAPAPARARAPAAAAAAAARAPAAAAASSSSSDTREPCKYGAGCTQRNPEHRKRFAHPTAAPAAPGSAAAKAATAAVRAGGGGGTGAVAAAPASAAGRKRKRGDTDDDADDADGAADSADDGPAPAPAAAAAVAAAASSSSMSTSRAMAMIRAKYEALEHTGAYKRVTKQKPTERTRRAAKAATAAAAATDADGGGADKKADAAPTGAVVPAVAAAAAAAADDDDDDGGDDDDGHNVADPNADPMRYVHALLPAHAPPHPATVAAWRTVFSRSGAAAAAAAATAAGNGTGYGAGGAMVSVNHIGYEGASFALPDHVDHMFFYAASDTQVGELELAHAELLLPVLFCQALGSNGSVLSERVQEATGLGMEDCDGVTPVPPKEQSKVWKVLSKPPQPGTRPGEAVTGPAVVQQLLASQLDDDAEGGHTVQQRVTSVMFPDARDWIARGERRLRAYHVLLRHLAAPDRRASRPNGRPALAAESVRLHVLSFVDTRYSFIASVLLNPKPLPPPNSAGDGSLRAYRLCLGARDSRTSYLRFVFACSTADATASLLRHYATCVDVWRTLVTNAAADFTQLWTAPDITSAANGAASAASSSGPRDLAGAQPVLNALVRHYLKAHNTNTGASAAAGAVPTPAQLHAMFVTDSAGMSAAARTVADTLMRTARGQSHLAAVFGGDGGVWYDKSKGVSCTLEPFAFLTAVHPATHAHLMA